jgi:hypothetical protein
MELPVGASVHARAKEPAVASTTFTLPDLPWAVLLATIVRDARPGDTIVVYTKAVQRLVEQAVRSAGREDLIVCQQDAPPAQRADPYSCRKGVLLIQSWSPKVWWIGSLPA